MSLLKRLVAMVGVLPLLAGQHVLAQDLADDPKFNSISMVVLRSPDPVKLSKFYEALGMKIAEVGDNGAVFFDLEGEGELFEILNLEEGTQLGGPKTSRTQQGVVALLNVTNVKEIARRAEAAGSPLVEPLGDANTAFVYYIADWENNIVGFLSPPGQTDAEKD